MKPKPTRGERIAKKLVQTWTNSVFLLSMSEDPSDARFIANRIRLHLGIQIDAAYAAGVRAGKRTKSTTKKGR